MNNYRYKKVGGRDVDVILNMGGRELELRLTIARYSFDSPAPLDDEFVLVNVSPLNDAAREILSEEEHAVMQTLSDQDLLRELYDADETISVEDKRETVAP